MDRDASVSWIVAQPVQLHAPGRRMSHVPDLLTVAGAGSVTLWDVRPAPRVDELFERVAVFTAEACAEVGWGYSVFTGLGSRPRSLNYRWLHESRRPQPWHATTAPRIESLLVGGAHTIGEIMAAEDGSGELTSTLWHLIWAGVVGCDLDQPLRATTELAWVGRRA